VTILCYHAVHSEWSSPMSVDPSSFARQAHWLARRRSVLRTSDALSRLGPTGRLPRGTACLTFDDGFASVYDHAFPVLRDLGLTATVFLVVQTLTAEGRPVDWVDTPPAFPLPTLTLDQILEMQEAGIEFASHSYSHFDLTTLSPEECLDDLVRSKELLQDLLDRPVTMLAYPRGRHDEQVQRAAEAAGYDYALSLPESAERPGPFAVPRVGVHRGNSLGTVRVKASRPYLALRSNRAFPVARRALRRLPVGQAG